jgi:hypothetical protein
MTDSESFKQTMEGLPEEVREDFKKKLYEVLGTVRRHKRIEEKILKMMVKEIESI